MKIIAQHFKPIFLILFLAHAIFKMLPRNFDTSIAFLACTVMTLLLSLNVTALFLKEKSTKSTAIKSLAFLFIGIEICAGIIALTSYKGILFNDIPTWLKISIGLPPSFIVFLSFISLNEAEKYNINARESTTS